MTELILDANGMAVALPESRDGGYNVQNIPLSVDIQMISGRTARELRGNVWQVSYQYGYFDAGMKNKVIAACEKGTREPIICGFLPQESDGALQYSSFIVTSFTRPKFMWSRRIGRGEETKETPLWADFSVELREVTPHD